MFLSVQSLWRGCALAVAASSLCLFPSIASAQIGGRPVIGGLGGGLGGGYAGGYGGGYGGGQPVNQGQQYSQNQGILASQSNTRNRFALNTSIAGSGVINQALDPVMAFGTALNNQSNQGGGGQFGGAYGGGGNQNQSASGQLATGTLTKNPPGVFINSLYNGSTSYAIYGNQSVTSYQGASPQVGGGYGGGYGGYPGGFGGGFGGGFPGGGFQNGGYGY